MVSITNLASDEPVYGNSHRVLVKLPANYPIGQPYAEMLTPLFHPHVFPSKVMCIGRKWLPSEFLDLFAKRVGAIICFNPDYFDFNSPANSTAMQWAKHHMKLFPTDTFDVEKTSIQWNEIKQVSWKNK
ncbi:MAG: hypothetical protein ACLP5V_11920 [Candidatus Bathyarchaeia archaeon]